MTTKNLPSGVPFQAVPLPTGIDGDPVLATGGVPVWGGGFVNIGSGTPSSPIVVAASGIARYPAQANAMAKKVSGVGEIQIWGVGPTNGLVIGSTTVAEKPVQIVMASGGSISLQAPGQVLLLGSTVRIDVASVSFNDGLAPLFTQSPKASGAGSKFSLGAQASAAGDGGALDVFTGNSIAGGVSGLGRLLAGPNPQFEWNDTGVAFYGTAPIAKPNITGSRGGNAALADLLTKLALLGLITDSTT